jgi:UDP-N-acetylmuramoylalanine--D-glutamate ligase
MRDAIIYVFPAMSVAHIIGLGRSGVAAARLLKREGWQVSVSDAGQSEELVDQQRSLAADDISVELGSRFSLEALAQTPERPDRIVVSPGVSWQLPVLAAAREQGIEVIGELELAWRYLQHCPWVGITGTNGKTTTTALVAAIFEAAGLKAPACGNIGYSACEVALSEQPIDWVIAEVSSYQAESSPTLAPNIGVWTTFTPDHLERHGTLENYREIKAHLLNLSKYKILNGDDAYLRQNLTNRWPDALWTSTQGQLLQQNDASALSVCVYVEDDWIVVGGNALQSEPARRVVSVDALRMPGAHNQQNLLQAIAVAHLAGIDAMAIAQAVASFSGVPHRLEYIRTWQGIEFINDSKATNYDAAQTGLAAVKSPAVLIAGGSPKVGDDVPWLKTIQAQAAAVLLIGDAAPAFAQRLEQSGYLDYEIVGTMEQAIPRAAELAQQQQAKVVLLSPACASFDQYRNFEERGEHFRQLCQTALL